LLQARGDDHGCRAARRRDHRTAGGPVRGGVIQTGLIPACLCGNSHSSFLYWARGRALWIDIWASLLFLTASPAQPATLTSPQVVKTETSAPEGVRIGFEEDIDTIAALLPETQVTGS